jgi:ADP-ribosylglycohydrolase
MLGAIFGDIAGSIYEFKNIKTTDFPLLGRDTTFTDDSVLAIAVADWLLTGDHGKEALVSTVKRYVRRYPNPMGGYGLRFKKWLSSPTSEPYHSWGNGSAMRVSPVGWFFKTLDETLVVAARSAEITHDHPEGIKGAQVIAAAVYLARTGSTKDEIRTYVTNAFGYDLSRTCDEIRPGYVFDESCAGIIPEALTAFLESDGFESAIRLAVSLGGDCDTLTCITGGVADAFYSSRTMDDVPLSGAPLRAWMAERVYARLTADLKEVVQKFEAVVRP